MPCVTSVKNLTAFKRQRSQEDLRIKNMVRNHCLAKSINDASWYLFRVWLEYFGKVFGKITVAVLAATMIGIMHFYQ
jgi:transposase